MKERHAEVEGIEWCLMDVRYMEGMEDASVDVAFDKGTFDAMIHGSPWSPPKEVTDNTSAYLRQVGHAPLLDAPYRLRWKNTAIMSSHTRDKCLDALGNLQALQVLYQCVMGICSWDF